jgi:membrane protein
MPSASSDARPAGRSWWRLITQTFADWSNHRAPTQGAALAFYTVFSLAPILVIAVAITGLVLGPRAARGELSEQLHDLLGRDGAHGVQQLVKVAAQPQSTIWATAASAGVMLFGATAVFGELQRALNTIWGVTRRPEGRLWGRIKSRLLSFLMVVGCGLLLLATSIFSSLVSSLEGLAGSDWYFHDAIRWLANNAVVFLVASLLFAVIFKVLPRAKVRWHDVGLGAAGTAALFTVGKYLIVLYLRHAVVASMYGAAASVVIVLLWAYYSAQILLLGAEFTQCYARMYGSRMANDGQD